MILTEEKVRETLSHILTSNDTVRFNDSNGLRFGPWCELDFRITGIGSCIFSFGFDENGTMVPAGSSTPTLKTFPLHVAALNRAQAVMITLQLKPID